MYVIVIEDRIKERSGYLLLHDNREYIDGQAYGDEYFIDSPDSSKHSIICGKRCINLVPFGSICVDKYNQNIKDYISNGGDVKYIKTKKIPLASTTSFPPLWMFPKFSKDNVSSNNVIEQKNLFENLQKYNPADASYIKTHFTKLGDKFYTMFEVGSIEELLGYDWQKIYSLQIVIEKCKFCGRAFVKDSRATQCELCISKGTGNIEKQKKWKSNPLNAEYDKLKRRLRKRGIEADSSYFKWVKEQKLNGVITLDWLEKWNKKDKIYQKICKYCENDIRYCTEWENAKKDFPHNISDIDQFLNEWSQKIQ